MKSSCTFLVVCISLVMGEADPWSTGYTAIGYGGYAGAGSYVAANPGAIHIAKRSAEPDADPWSTGYTTIGYGGYSSLGYTVPAYSTLGYTTGYTGGYRLYNGYGGYGYGAYGGGYGTVGIARGYGGYAGAGSYVAANPGAIHIAKRSAEPDADP